jgi:hypothetical protein
MALAQDIREQAARYLSDELPLSEFEDWLVDATWNVHQSGDSEAADLAYATELKFAEYTSGHLPLEDLRGFFARIAQPLPWASFTVLAAIGEFPPVRVVSSQNWAERQFSGADREPVGAHE